MPAAQHFGLLADASAYLTTFNDIVKRHSGALMTDKPQQYEMRSSFPDLLLASEPRWTEALANCRAGNARLVCEEAARNLPTTHAHPLCFLFDFETKPLPSLELPRSICIAPELAVALSITSSVVISVDMSKIGMLSEVSTKLPLHVRKGMSQKELEEKNKPANDAIHADSDNEKKDEQDEATPDRVLIHHYKKSAEPSANTQLAFTNTVFLIDVTVSDAWLITQAAHWRRTGEVNAPRSIKTNGFLNEEVGHHAAPTMYLVLRKLMMSTVRYAMPDFVRAACYALWETWPGEFLNVTGVLDVNQTAPYLNPLALWITTGLDGKNPVVRPLDRDDTRWSPRFALSNPTSTHQDILKNSEVFCFGKGNNRRLIEAGGGCPDYFGDMLLSIRRQTALASFFSVQDEQMAKDKPFWDVYCVNWVEVLLTIMGRLPGISQEDVEVVKAWKKTHDPKIDAEHCLWRGETHELKVDDCKDKKIPADYTHEGKPLEHRRTTYQKLFDELVELDATRVHLLLYILPLLWNTSARGDGFRVHMIAHSKPSVGLATIAASNWFWDPADISYETYKEMAGKSAVTDGLLDTLKLYAVDRKGANIPVFIVSNQGKLEKQEQHLRPLLPVSTVVPMGLADLCARYGLTMANVGIHSSVIMSRLCREHSRNTEATAMSMSMSPVDVSMRLVVNPVPTAPAWVANRSNNFNTLPRNDERMQQLSMKIAQATQTWDKRATANMAQSYESRLKYRPWLVRTSDQEQVYFDPNAMLAALGVSWGKHFAAAAIPTSYQRFINAEKLDNQKEKRRFDNLTNKQREKLGIPQGQEYVPRTKEVDPEQMELMIQGTPWPKKSPGYLTNFSMLSLALLEHVGTFAELPSWVGCETVQTLLMVLEELPKDTEVYQALKTFIFLVHGVGDDCDFLEASMTACVPHVPESFTVLQEKDEHTVSQLLYGAACVHNISLLKNAYRQMHTKPPPTKEKLRAGLQGVFSMPEEDEKLDDRIMESMGYRDRPDGRGVPLVDKVKPLGAVGMGMRDMDDWECDDARPLVARPRKTKQFNTYCHYLLAMPSSTRTLLANALANLGLVEALPVAESKEQMRARLVKLNEEMGNWRFKTPVSIMGFRISRRVQASPWHLAALYLEDPTLLRAEAIEQMTPFMDALHQTVGGWCDLEKSREWTPEDEVHAKVKTHLEGLLPEKWQSGENMSAQLAQTIMCAVPDSNALWVEARLRVMELQSPVMKYESSRGGSILVLCRHR